MGPCPHGVIKGTCSSCDNRGPAQWDLFDAFFGKQQKENRCNAYHLGKYCVLPKGHNMGNPDIPKNHQFGSWGDRIEENMEFGIVDNSTPSDTEPVKPKKTKKLKARDDRFPKDGGRPIKASVPGYNKIPWTQGTLTLLAQSPDGQIHYAKTMEEKRNFAWANFKWILVCWPGKYSQDIFLIDDLKAFRKALGFKLKTEPEVVIDEDGNEWVLDALFPKAPPSGSVSITPNPNTGFYPYTINQDNLYR